MLSCKTIKPTVAVALLISACFAQQPEFEVATIKPSPPPQMGRMFMGTRGGPGTDDPLRFNCNNCTLTMLLTMAYDVQRFQISGPQTLDSEHFEVAAKVPAGATKEQFRLMIQNLLADRFKLKLHRETKDQPMYDLVVAKGGPKFKESAAQLDAPADQSPTAPPPGPPRTDKDGYPVMPPQGRGSMMAISPNGARMQGQQETMDGLAGRLSSMVARPVKNETGLKGKYDFTLTFAPDMSNMPGGRMMGPPPGGDGPGPGPMSAPQENGPTIFTALQEQLGLKLEPKKGPVETLVIDHVEKTPTEN